MIRLTLKSAAELIAEKTLSRRARKAADALIDAIEERRATLAALRSLQNERNALLARDHNTDDVDARLSSLLERAL